MSYEIELRNRVAQTGTTFWVSSSKDFIEILLSSYNSKEEFLLKFSSY